MPNWCDNHVVFTGEKDSLDQLRQAFDKWGLFSTFLPLPENQEDEIEKARNLWGTKWDIDSADGSYTETEGVLTFRFMSAWTPPVVFYDFIGPHLNVVVDAKYIEMGNAFYGYYTTDGFEITVSYSSFSEIPEDIVNTFELENWEDQDTDTSSVLPFLQQWQDAVTGEQDNTVWVVPIWIKQSVPSKKNGRKGTRKGWKRKNPPHWIYVDLKSMTMSVEDSTLIYSANQATPVTMGISYD